MGNMACMEEKNTAYIMLIFGQKEKDVLRDAGIYKRLQENVS
jgi:hypothetical protein